MSIFMTHLKIGRPLPVFRDLKRNRWWIAASFLVILVLILVSATLFFWLERAEQTSLTWFSSLYFTVINFTTVGFGDIVPKTSYGQGLAMFNSLAGLLSFGWLVAVFTLALQPAPIPTPSFKTLHDRKLLGELVDALLDADLPLQISSTRS